MSCYRDDTICTICGIIIIQPTDDDELEDDPSLQYRGVWRGVVFALAGPSWGSGGNTSKEKSEWMNVSSEDVHPRRAEVDGFHAQMQIQPDGPRIMPQRSYAAGVNGHHGLTHRDHCFFGIHSACLDIAQRVMKTSRNASIQNMGDLWMTLERRCTKTANDCSFSHSFVPKIPENRPGEEIKLSLRRYYVPLNHIGGEQDEEEEEWWYYDPLQIPDLATSLMSNLTQYVPETPASKFRSSFENLPQKIKDQIADLIPGQPLAASCNYLMPESQWKRVFLQIPFLWDIDEKAIAEKVLEADVAGVEWDWEKITRQLMVPVEMTVETGDWDKPWCPWSYEKAGLTVPLGLNNRRRIWQILEDLYPNDVGLNET